MRPGEESREVRDQWSDLRERGRERLSQICWCFREVNSLTNGKTCISRKELLMTE